MRVRAHHLRYFFFGLLALIGLQIALFDKIFECAGNVEQGIPLQFRNMRNRETNRIIELAKSPVEDSADGQKLTKD